MSDDSQGAAPSSPRPAEGEGARKPVLLPPGLVQLRDGVFFDSGVPGPILAAGVNKIFLSNAYFRGLHYPVLLRALYGVGPALPRVGADPLVRFAAKIVRFDPARRALYHDARIEDGAAEYVFEEAAAAGQAAPASPVRLDVDEFVAAMWCRGIRFGIDAPAVEAAIALGRVGPVVVARPLEMVQARDAVIVNLQDMKRSYQPRQMADGRLDLLSFKSAAPPVKQHALLLRKTPGALGLPGYALSGRAELPRQSRDIDLAALAGAGTAFEQRREGAFLVATRDGFLNIDPVSGVATVDAKVIGHDGVSNRTTGNLRLSASYEEFGEVQEQRLVEGDDITIHGDVFGAINSRGGKVVLHSNMVGGSVQNAGGDIEIGGVASGAVLQTRAGTVRVRRAESCTISGTRVVIEHASNCEILAEEVELGQAEGCAVGARQIEIGRAGPRKQIDMLVFVLVPDMAGFRHQVAELEERAGQLGAAGLKLQQEVERISGQTEVRHYLLLANKIRKQELVLTPEQSALYHKMAAAAAPELKTLSKLSAEINALAQQKEQMLGHARDAAAQGQAAAARSHCSVRAVDGETLVRSMTLHDERICDYAPKDIKAMLRGAQSGVAPIFSDHHGALDWRPDLGQP